MDSDEWSDMGTEANTGPIETPFEQLLLQKINNLEQKLDLASENSSKFIADQNKKEEDAERKLVICCTTVLDRVQKLTNSLKPFHNMYWIDKAIIAIFGVISAYYMVNYSLITENVKNFLNSVLVLGLLVQIAPCCIVLKRIWDYDGEPRSSERLSGKLSNENFDMIQTRRTDLIGRITLLHMKAFANLFLSAMTVIPVMIIHGRLYRNSYPSRSPEIFDFIVYFLEFLAFFSCSFLLPTVFPIDPQLGDMGKLGRAENDEETEPLE